VAAYVSPPFSEYTKLILKISSNIGADLMLCLMAARAGRTNCEDGFAVLASFLTRAHVDRTQVVLRDGHGGPDDRFSPQAVIDLLRYWLARPEFGRVRQMLPILGEPGNLSGICTTCPAKGKVFAKPGTVAAFDAVNNAVIPLTGILPVFNDLATISAYLQEDAAA
jgi:D-alanyl-D-alanine carboxypeptidase/D-alanyl-D-alanine-endopeptidase (penicillin-binding protein 4)